MVQIKCTIIYAKLSDLLEIIYLRNLISEISIPVTEFLSYYFAAFIHFVVFKIPATTHLQKF
jgi:hypothetical protein